MRIGYARVSTQDQTSIQTQTEDIGKAPGSDERIPATAGHSWNFTALPLAALPSTALFA